MPLETAGLLASRCVRQDDCTVLATIGEQGAVRRESGAIATRWEAMDKPAIGCIDEITAHSQPFTVRGEARSVIVIPANLPEELAAGNIPESQIPVVARCQRSAVGRECRAQPRTMSKAHGSHARQRTRWQRIAVEVGKSRFLRIPFGPGHLFGDLLRPLFILQSALFNRKRSVDN